MGAPARPGHDAALDRVDVLPLEHCYPFHAIRADLLRRLDLADQAAAAHRTALELTDVATSAWFMQGRTAAMRAATA